MPQKPLFARARPQEIRITERYSFRADLGYHSQTSMQEEPQGEIVVLVPYDGDRYFTPQALQDVAAAVETARRAGRSQPLLARIGFLALSGRAASTQAGPGRGVLPLDLPVYGDVLSSPGRLRDDAHLGRLSIAYDPRPAAPPYLELMATLSDETAALGPALARLERLDPEADGAEIDDVARQIVVDEGFTHGLRQTFRFDLVLPGSADGGNGQLPMLAAMSLDWDIRGSYRQLQLTVGEDEWPFRYDPTAATLSWGDVPFQPVAPEGTGDGERHYQINELTLSANEPDAFYERQHATGRAVIVVPGLLSPLDVRYFNALGQEERAPIHFQTRLDLAFRINLAGAFRQRPYSPYRRFLLATLPLSGSLVAEVRAVLQSERFRDIREWRLTEEDGQRRIFLTANRPQGGGRFRLWMQIEGAAPTGDDHPLYGGVGPSRRPAGTLIVHMKGELAGDPRRPVELLNDLHRQLKARLAPIGTAE